MKPLLATLSDLATTRPWTVLMQGKDYFRIEHLIRQARRDEKTDPTIRERAFSWEEVPGTGKVTVYHYRQPIFWEPGS